MYNEQIGNGLQDDVMNNIMRFDEGIHLAEWGNMANKLEDWAKILRGAIELFSKGEPMSTISSEVNEIS